MVIRRWDFEGDRSLVNSFLSSAALAHKTSKKSEDWFYWKFRQCPYGEAILICAFDGETIAGCVAMGKWLCERGGKQMLHGGAFETFVHPAYQGKGLFVKLISAVEEACKEENLQFITTFPNKNSFRGYEKMGHTPQFVMQCKLLILHPFRILRNFRSLRKSFVPNETTSQLHSITSKEIPLFNDSKIRHIWTKEYLKWRFEGLSKSEYIVQDTQCYFAIARVGYRDKIKECQIIYIERYDNGDIKQAFRDFCKYIRHQVAPDMITCTCSKSSVLAKCTRLFVPVPTNVNFLIKKINPEIADVENIDIRAIAFHTY